MKTRTEVIENGVVVGWFHTAHGPEGQVKNSGNRKTPMTPERKAERAEARKRQKHLDTLVGVADKFHPLGDSEIIEGYIHGVEMIGNVELVNVLLEKAGYRPVRITHNMLNPASKRWCIDINTPAYCDPGCESYHTM